MSQSLPQFSGCQVLERLRSGPVADEYRALQEPLGRTVLIKALSPSILPSSPFAASLEHEARLLARLEHPNILKLYDFVRHVDAMWLVLEYFEGWSLRELLSRLAQTGEAPRGVQPLHAVAIVYELTLALEHAHGHGIVHRNLRPETIFLGKSGRIKLTEFVSASDERIPTSPELMDGEVIAPVYFSPEQILGETPDPRSDLFSLGVILYELLSGVRPFDGPDIGSISQRIRHDVPQPLSRLAKEVPSQLSRIVQRLLEKIPADRFASASELRLALESFFGEEGEESEKYIRAALSGVGWVTSLPASETPQRRVAQVQPLGPALYGLALLGFLVLFGGGLIQIIAERDGAPRVETSGGGGLALRPANPGYLRVVADPWAHVIVNGELVETTPFAAAIPLKAGTHYIRLEHPAAPTERRTIRLSSGENVLLNVKMAVEQGDAGPPDDAGSDARDLSP